jgi:serine/threonine protein kinase
MGEVYRARDTRLDRTVAIKVLPTGSADNADLRQRLEREAKAVSSLNHPHICILYDVGHQDGTDYLVMEYLEGETLATRLEKGALPTAEVLKYAVQMADALDKAHRQGLVHRDLKPGNIMLTKSGAKLLDFGLAKLAAAGDVVQGVTGVTRTTPLTGEGTILGTLHYMPPEQLEGTEADARSDIFAFGCVLYEMATGRRAFEGKSQASLIAAIMGKDPAPVSTISQVAPPALDRIVSRCLAKDPDDRWQTARDLMHELQWLTSGDSQLTMAVPVTGRRKSRERLAWLIAALSLVAAMGLGLYQLLAEKQPSEVVRSLIAAPGGTRFVTSAGGQIALSPDGLTLAFVAIDSSDGKSQLWVRPLKSLVALPLPGTEGALFPFWSADSRFIAFFAASKLKKIQSSGGPALKICDAPDGRGGSWNRDGVILFCPNYTDVIYHVSAAGGTPVAATVRDTLHHDFTHRWPHFLPDGRHFLYFARTVGDAGAEDDAICLGSLDGKAPRRLINAKSEGVYANGYILYLRDNTLMAQPFDPGSMELTRDAVPIADDASYAPSISRGVFSASQNGLLVYQSGAIDAGSALRVFNRAGQQVDSVGGLDRYYSPRYSPDGTRVTVDLRDPSSGNTDVWIYDLARNIRTRFTFDADEDYSPVWSKDGTRLAWVSDRAGQCSIYLKNANGVGDEQSTPISIPSGRLDLNDWSADGRHIGCVVVDSAGNGDIWILALGDSTRAFPLFQTRFDEGWPTFSPDGRWLAYMSTESGKEEVYVTSFAHPGAKWQVSVNEGDRPSWRRDGKELFYTDNADKLMVAKVDGSGAAFQIGSVAPLFQLRPVRPGSIYDVTTDGERFLVNTTASLSVASAVNLVVNWQEELKDK